MPGSVDVDSRVGTEIAGYRIERVLGRGGMAVVYLAHHERLDRHVALKLLAPELAEDEQFRERFLRESKLAASLDHPNVIPIHDADEADGVLFIAMRYVEGTDLGRLLKGEEPVSPAGTLAILDRVASALDAAHARGLVHRDVKPENVLLAEAAPGEPEHVYLTDFGLSTRLGDEQEADDAAGLLGSLDYLAPEQIRDQPVTAQTDVYALGCVLFRALTGEAPFSGGGRLAVLWGHLEKPPPSASERDPDLPVALDPVLTRAMAKEPRERHESCAALIEQTRDALGLSRQAAAPPPRRKRGLVLAGAVLTIAVVVAAVVPALLLTGGDDGPAVGEEWSRVVGDQATFGGSAEAIVQGLARGETRLVAVGTDGDPPEVGDAGVWTSSDGLSWTRVRDRELGGPGFQGMLAVAAGPAGFVAVGITIDDEVSLDAAVWTSPDGERWQRGVAGDDVFGGPPYEEGRGFALDEPSVVGEPSLQYMSGLVVGGPGFVAVGGDFFYSQAAVWTSPDGMEWSRVPADAQVFGTLSGSRGPRMLGVAANGERLVAVGGDLAAIPAPVPSGCPWTGCRGCARHTTMRYSGTARSTRKSRTLLQAGRGSSRSACATAVSRERCRSPRRF